MSEMVQGSGGGGKGLGIAALVCVVLGFCFWPVALVGMVLGVVALVTSKGGPGRTLGVISLPVGVVAMVVNIVALIAILLPALAAAREAAQRVVGMSQGNTLGTALAVYESSNNDRLPERDVWGSELVRLGLVTRADLESPFAPAGYSGPSYFLVYHGMPRTSGDSREVLLYEHPDFEPGGGVVVYQDGSAAWLEEAAFRSVIGGLRDRDGSPYAPHLMHPLP